MPSKTVPREMFERHTRDLRRDLDLHQYAIAAWANNELRWLHETTPSEDRDMLDGGHYRFAVARLDSANGGLFFAIYDHHGQRSQCHLAYLDDAACEVQKINPIAEHYRLFAPAVQKALALRRKEMEHALAQ